MVLDIHIHSKISNISEKMQDRDVIATGICE